MPRAGPRRESSEIRRVSICDRGKWNLMEALNTHLLQYINTSNTRSMDATNGAPGIATRSVRTLRTGLLALLLVTRGY